MPTQLEIALTALRRIRSLEEKNVPKYAQQIAKETLDQIEKLLPGFERSLRLDLTGRGVSHGTPDNH